MYGYSFPDLNKWFIANSYVVHNECELIEINMIQNLSQEIIDEFCKEFAIYICSLRCPTKELFDNMVDAINGNNPLSEEDKSILRSIFSNGFISKKTYLETLDYLQSFDEDGIKGYFGETLYYLIRGRYAKDIKISIEPEIPKTLSKNSGIDFLEIRKDFDGYYFIVGEVKTTENSYSTRSEEVADTFLNRINENFSDMFLTLQGRDDKSDTEYTKFLEEMTSIFYRFYHDSDKKRLSGVFNYNFAGKRINSNAFSTWKDKPFEINNNPVCRKIKLIGIYNIETVIEKVRDLLWNVL